MQTVPKSAVLFLHGLGDTGHSWAHIFKPMASRFSETLFVFPTAAQKRVTLNYGSLMPAWYDIVNLDNTKESILQQDRQGMHEASGQIQELVAWLQDKKGIPLEKIVLGGFSQGAVVSLYTALIHPEYCRLGGLLLLSGYLPLSCTVFSPANRSKILCDLAIFWGHGDSDPVIQHGWAMQSVGQLEKLGYTNITFQSYKDLGHGICPKEERDIFEFIASRIQFQTDSNKS